MGPCSLILEAWLFVVSCEFCLCARDRFVGLCMVCVLVCAVSFSVVFLCSTTLKSTENIGGITYDYYTL